jgi:peroxiredoxin Q/BCP
MLKEGSKLSPFKLSNQYDKIIKFPNKKISILFFYPKANTPGCTKEAIEFDSNLKKIEKLNACVFGISKDSIKRQKNFSDKFNISLDLLSDENNDICEKFGVWVKKSMYGRTFFGIERSTFILGKNMKVLNEWRKVKVRDHVLEVISFLKSI